MPSKTQVDGNGQKVDETAEQENHTRSVEVQRYLQGVQFPANKHDLVEHAVERQAPRRIIDLLAQLPTPEFGSPNATKLTVYNSFEELTREIERYE